MLQPLVRGTMVHKPFFNQSQEAFRIFKLWPKDIAKNNTLGSWLSKTLVLVSTLIGVLIIIISDAIHEMRFGEFTGITSKILYVTSYFCCFYKAYNAAMAIDQLYDCVRCLEELSSTYKDQYRINRALNLYRKVFITGTCLMLCCGVFFFVAPLGTDRYRPLPFTPQFSFLNTTKTPNWHFLYAYEATSTILAIVTSMAYDTMFCGMCCLCATLLTCTRCEVAEMDVIIEDHSALEDAMKRTINNITKITNVITTISDTFSNTNMINIVYNCSMMALGLYINALLPTIDLTYIAMVMVIVLQTFQLGIYCYFSQSVIDERSTLQQELYFTRWYDASKNFKTMLLLTLFEAQKERCIHAGKVLPLSNATFMEVIKKAYTFFTFFQNFH